MMWKVNQRGKHEQYCTDGYGTFVHNAAEIQRFTVVLIVKAWEALYVDLQA